MSRVRARDTTSLASVKTVNDAAIAAQEAADDARQSAVDARIYATSALVDLADIENVIGALEWIEKHGQYVPTADPEVIYGKFYFYPTFVQASEIKPDTRYYTLEVSPVTDPTKMYLYYEANATGYSPTTDTDPVGGKQYYRIIATEVETPSQGSLSSYYEISEYTNVIFPEGNNSYEIYTHTEDIEIVDGKNYFTVEATQVVNLDADDLYLYYVLDNGVYIKADQITQGVIYYTLEGTMVDEPDITDIDEYYEQTIGSQPIVNPSEAGAYELSEVDKTIGDYIRTHLALTDEGLMIFNDDDSGRIVLSESGMEVRDKKNRVVATYGEDTIIGNTKEGYYIKITNEKLSFMQATPDDNPDTDIEVAHISGERLTIPHAVIVNSMGVGDPTLGAWQWVITNNQHLTLKWIKEGD